jgi:hypothetical protein
VASTKVHKPMSSTKTINRAGKRRWSLRAGVITTLVVSAVPASAAVVVQNFMSAEVIRQAPCLAKVDGLDASTGSATAPGGAFRDLTRTTNSTAGVPLLNEQIVLSGYRGDRTTVTDVVRVKNTCAYAVDVFLIAEPGLATATTSGDWQDLSMRVYLGADKITSAVTPNAAESLLDFSVAADWDQDPLEIDPGTATAGVVTDNQTGTVNIPAGEEVQLGYIVDTGSAATSPAASTTPSILNYTVNATKA